MQSSEQNIFFRTAKNRSQRWPCILGTTRVVVALVTSGLIYSNHRAQALEAEKALAAKKHARPALVPPNQTQSCRFHAQGLSTLVPGKNQWTGPIVYSSAKAGAEMHKALIASTGAKDRGVVKRSDLSGFNWCKVPVVLVGMGFMSNPTEDKKLSDPAYQAKLVRGMVKGTAIYLSK